ncbi:MAG: 50S ribosomal protein L31 [Patescibacteria group bacterium]
MKNDIHPTYHKDAKFSCACGNSFTSGSTRPEIRVEICSKCHPFYTGKQKLVDTAGIVDIFKKRAAVSTQLAASKTVKKPRKTSAEKKAK